MSGGLLTPIFKDSMEIYASSDHHFLHKNIIKYADRPFDIEDVDCVTQCANHMINKHNSVVTNEDYVLLVGDMSCTLKGREDLLKVILKGLNGKKILVRGNHDHLPDEFYLDCGFIDVVDSIKAPPYFVSHYPCYTSKWKTDRENKYMSEISQQGYHTIIHGHVHNKNPDKWDPDGFKRINVCVDYEPNDFTPVNLRIPEIKDFIVKRYT